MSEMSVTGIARTTADAKAIEQLSLYCEQHGITILVSELANHRVKFDFEADESNGGFRVLRSYLTLMGSIL